MRYLSLSEILSLYRRIMSDSGGTVGVRDWGLLNAALIQPRMRIAGEELYPGAVEKAATLGFSLVMNHPMVDGNKRLGHAAMELFLALNGYEIGAQVDEQEKVLLALAAGDMGREEFTRWLKHHVIRFGD